MTTMRDFFKAEMRTLKVKTGLNQYENISSLPDAQDQLKTLFDGLVSICNEFPFIPDEAKQIIIREAIIKDQEFTGLNARVIWKWLNGKKDLYFKEMAHQKIEEQSEPLTGEERDKWLQEWLKVVQGGVMQSVPKVDMYADMKKRLAPDHTEKYIPDPEKIIQHELHLQWIKENTDPKTGEITGVDEKTWLKNKGL